MKKEIAYLGIMDWANAIDKATNMCMLIPNMSTMNKIYDIIKRDNENIKNPIEYRHFQTSTVHHLNFRRILHPVPKDWLNDVDDFENKHTTDRDVKRHTYAIAPDLTDDDIYTGNYFFTDKSNH